jgi:AcrR family transcriptional regulator
VLDSALDLRSRRREQTRAEILQAAWQLCREQGLAALSLRDLAARVGMRAPSLYSYFDSKDAIYDAMFAEGQRALLASQAGLTDLPRTRAGLLRGAMQFFEFCVSDPVRYQLMFQRVVPGFVPSPESYALAVQVLAQFDEVLAELGLTDPALRDLWTGLFAGLTAQQITNDPGGDRWERTVPLAVEMFADFVGIPSTQETP